MVKDEADFRKAMSLPDVFLTKQQQQQHQGAEALRTCQRYRRYNVADHNDNPISVTQTMVELFTHRCRCVPAICLHTPTV